MKKLLLTVLLLTSISFSQEQDKKDTRTLFRVGVPAITTFVAYKVLNPNDMDFLEQLSALFLSMSLSTVSMVAYEWIDNTKFQPSHLGEYGLGTILGVSITLLAEF